MKIIFFEVPKVEQSYFSGLMSDMEVSFFEEKLNEENISLAKDADIVSVFVNSTVNKNVMYSLPNLKFIATRSTGFDHIDMEYANTKGIKVSNVPAYGSFTVAEFTFGLILSLSRKIYDAVYQLKGKNDFSINALKGFDLHGKTIGVVGTGRIGKNVVNIAKGLGMNVIAYDLHPNMLFAKESNIKYKSFEELLAESDILTFHAPYTKENRHLINKENVYLIKKGIYIINTARGELIDTETLYFGLKEGIVAGFGGDVLECERQLKDGENFLKNANIYQVEKRIVDLNNELIKMPNVIITPHIAFCTNEAVHEIVETTIQNIKGFVTHSLVNLVN